MNIRVKRKTSEFKNIKFHDFTLLSENILKNEQEFFFTKVDREQSITDIVLLGFSLILLSKMFISECLFHTPPSFIFRKESFFRMFIFQFSEYDIRILLFVFGSEFRNRLTIKHVRK